MSNSTKQEEVTTRRKLETRLVGMGMSYPQAIDVLNLAIPKMDEMADEYNITWDSPADGYPEMIYDLLFMTVKETALEYIIEKAPNAWFKPMFQ